MRTRVILNPVAGGGGAVAALRREIGSLPGGAGIRVSEGPGWARRLAREASREGIRRIVAAGGDGTVSDVASGLLDARHSGPLGILPIGTGNDLARSLGIPPGLRPSVALLESGRPTAVDAIELGPAGSSTTPAFAWNAVIGGFGGRISDRMPVDLKRRWRSLSYLRAAVAELGALRPHAVTLEVDGERLALELLMLVVANGRYAGGRIPFAPGAAPDDGRIDVIGIRAMPPARLAAVVASVLAGRHLGSHRVVHRKGRRVSVEAGPGFWLNVDGETWKEGSAEFRVRPAALRVIRPLRA